ncbi:MAG: P-loop NTPase [Candidatus Verstraetearchaeota archaeon]|nr:P-loop NTPase [Candidatus Verstraetearchaeota archaeon]
MKSVAFYGKGGIGKSTLASNIAAALGADGLKILLVGCDPKADSTINLLGRRPPQLLELMKQEKRPDPSKFIEEGFAGVACVEIGGPEPGVGCAGRGLIVGIRYLTEVFDIRRFDLVIFDVPADIVCGGLAVVMKEGYSESALIVTSDEFMSLYAANNLCRGFRSLGARVGGVLYNRSTTGGRRYVGRFSSRVGVPILGDVPLSEELIRADRARKTIIESSPASNLSGIISSVAKSVYLNSFSCVPNWIQIEELEEMCAGDS